MSITELDALALSRAIRNKEASCLETMYAFRGPWNKTRR